MYNQDERTRYLKPKHCLLKPFFKNDIQQLNLGKFLNFFENWGFVPQLEPRKLLLIIHLQRHKELQLLSHHLWIKIHVVMNMYLFEKLKAECWVTNE
jgi:hypothetical protein